MKLLYLSAGCQQVLFRFKFSPVDPRSRPKVDRPKVVRPKVVLESQWSRAINPVVVSKLQGYKAGVSRRKRGIQKALFRPD